MLDYFQARYYSAEQGRFVSPDPRNAGADLSNPQSWNGYAYGLNSPLVYTDPDGLASITDPCAGIPNCVSVTASSPGLSPVDEMLYRSLLFDQIYRFSLTHTEQTPPPPPQRQQQQRPPVKSNPQNGACPSAFMQKVYRAALDSTFPYQVDLASAVARKTGGTALFGLSASAAGSLPGLPRVSRAVSGQVALAADSKGNVGLLLSAAVGFGAGDGLAAGVDVGVSRGSSIYDMAGPSFSFGFGGGNGIGGALQVSNNAGGTVTATGGYAIGGYGLGGTYGPTKVISLVCQ